ncbi:hypothetical protein [Streptomyces sp. NPDC013457]|uniref:hypothetical protein n=1 Tax=Streptomyces sp. NPDC013457 TaxID=3364866 RepID=UPI0036FA89B6
MSELDATESHPVDKPSSSELPYLPEPAGEPEEPLEPEDAAEADADDDADDSSPEEVAEPEEPGAPEATAEPADADGGSEDALDAGDSIKARQQAARG